MKDSHILQFVSMLLGILSIILPYIVLSFARSAIDGIIYLIALGVALLVSIVGIILAAVSIKKARDYGDNKAKGIVGLITSIIGTLSCLIVLAIIGSIIAIAMSY